MESFRFYNRKRIKRKRRLHVALAKQLKSRFLKRNTNRRIRGSNNLGTRRFTINKPSFEFHFFTLSIVPGGNHSDFMPDCRALY